MNAAYRPAGLTASWLAVLSALAGLAVLSALAGLAVLSALAGLAGVMPGLVM
jgi:hypothetical protein